MSLCPSANNLIRVVGCTEEELQCVDSLRATLKALADDLSGAKECCFPQVVEFKNLKRESRLEYINAIRACIGEIKCLIEFYESAAYIRVDKATCKPRCRRGNYHSR